MTTDIDIDTAIAKLEGLEAAIADAQHAYLVAPGDTDMSAMVAAREARDAYLRNEAMPLLRAAREQLRAAEELAAARDRQIAQTAIDVAAGRLRCRADANSIIERAYPSAASEIETLCNDADLAAIVREAEVILAQPLPAPPALVEPGR